MAIKTHRLLIVLVLKMKWQNVIYLMYDLVQQDAELVSVEQINK